MSSNSVKVTKSRFEFEEDGHIAYLEFETDDRGWMTLLHTEVPPALRGRGIATTLARTALEYARDNTLEVDIVCPVVADFHRQKSRVQKAGPLIDLGSARFRRKPLEHLIDTAPTDLIFRHGRLGKFLKETREIRASLNPWLKLDALSSL